MPIYTAAVRPRGAGLLLCAAVLAAGCASESLVKDYVPQIVTPYRIDIQQGNFVTQDMVDKLQAGQTRDQVRFILGTPLLMDVFHADRWDYMFRSSKGWREPDKHKLTVYFKNERLERWESDVPPAPVANAQPAEEPGFFGRLLGSKPAAPAPAPAATPPTAAVSPPADAAGSNNSSTTAGDRPVPPPPTTQAAPPTIAPAGKPADQADKPEEKPGVVRRMFGWLMPGTGLSAASPEESRAASPDPAKPPAAAPNPPQAVAPKPEPQPEPAPTIAPPTGTVTVGPVVAEPSPVAPPPAPVVKAAPAPAPAPVTPPPAPAPAPPTVVAQAAPAVAPAPAVVPAPPPAPPARAPEPTASPNEIISAIEQWRNAWQDKDATRYLAFYAPDFKPAGGLTRAKWEAQRRDRLTKPSFIIVRIVDPQVTLSGGDVAVAVFVQEYESSILKESGRKTLKFGSYGGKWLIREETMTAR